MLARIALALVDDLAQIDPVCQKMVERAPPETSPQMIKMADKISNLRSLASSPPTDWSTERIAEYGAWAARVVAGCRNANAGLASQFDATLAALEAASHKQPG